LDVALALALDVGMALELDVAMVLALVYGMAGKLGGCCRCNVP
jgi:hypothetical protein